MLQWNDEDYRAVHALGNGRMCVYEKGPNILQLFGPTYSVPTILELSVLPGDTQGFTSYREEETDIWHHVIELEENKTCELTDTVHTKHAAFIRNIIGNTPITFMIRANAAQDFCRYPSKVTEKQFFIGYIPENVPFYTYCSNEYGEQGFVNGHRYYVVISVMGDAVCTWNEKELIFSLTYGQLSVAVDEDYRQALKIIHELEQSTFEKILQQRRAAWKRSAQIRQSRYGESEKKYAGVIDDIAVLIKTQQSVSGGILAGHAYHLAYIRDNYGVNRGLLAMKCYEESRRLLRFYADIFKKYGQIHNAQATDTFGFHIHEQDASEITGYMILMGTDYVDATGDSAILREIKSLLWWCVEQQHFAMKKGMLPFNGDETYIAGGILPRSTLNDASMEATVLYDTACSRLLKYKAEIGWSPEQEKLLFEDQEQIRRQFEANFCRDGNLFCNRPGFYDTEPEIRYGVRVCGHGMGLSVRNGWGDYVCPKCAMSNEKKPAFSNYGVSYRIPAALMMPLFVGAELIPLREYRQAIQSVVTGLMEQKNAKKVGYDMGLATYAVQRYLPDLSETMLKNLLGLRDAVGAWTEYYVEDKPSGCMYRPWESAINIAALLSH